MNEYEAASLEIAVMDHAELVEYASCKLAEFYVSPAGRDAYRTILKVYDKPDNM